MFSPKYLLSIVFLLIVAQSAFGQDCYQVQRSNSGGEAMMYTEQLQATACDLQDLLQTDGITDFAIIGKDYYPLMAYVNPVGYYNQVHEEAVASVEQQHDSYIMVAKDHLENSQLNYRVEIKFPTTGLLSTLSPFERGALEQQVYDAIAAKAAEYDNMATFNATVEAEGLQVLVEAMEQLMDGTFEMADPMVQAGFDKLPVKDGEEYERTGTPFTGAGANADDYVYDYTGLQVSVNGGGSEPFRNKLTAASTPIRGSVIQSYQRVFIITDEESTGEDLNLASAAFESATEHFVLWIHYLEKEEAKDSVYLMNKVNYTDTEAELVADFYFNQILSAWVPSLYSEDPTTLDEGNSGVNRMSNNPCLELAPQWAKRCLFQYIDLEENGPVPFSLGVAIGLLDGLLANLQMAYEAINKPVSWFSSIASYCGELYEHYEKKASLMAVWEKATGDAKAYIETQMQALADVYDFFTTVYNSGWSFWEGVLNKISKGFMDWVGDATDGKPSAGYTAGVAAMNLIILVFTGGGSAAAKGASIIGKISIWLKGILNPANARGAIKGLLDEMAALSNSGGCFICKNLLSKLRIMCKGCFVVDTPVLMACKASQFSLRNSTKAMAIAAMPIVAVPIQEVQLLDYALAHETVNSTYGVTVSTDDDIYLGLMDKDPYTSDQQRERDNYQLDDENWNEVVFEEVHGGSTAKLAWHKDWIEKQSYEIDAVVNLDLPEQGISGPFRITSIKHIIPQKKPVDDDEADEYGYKPVTGLFIHEASDVWRIKFDNGEELGVTHNHPIYSTSIGDWQFAGMLSIGEEVLTKQGGAIVVSKEVDQVQQVYNLEVKDYHNFLVNPSGIVVHNTPNCIPSSRKLLDNLGISKALKNPGKHKINDGPNAAKIKEKFGKDPNKKISVCFDDTGMPDFSEFIPEYNGNKISFEIDNLTGHSSNDMVKARSKLEAEFGLDFSSNGAIEIPGYEGITWTFHHHQDGKTMQLVPFDINNKAGHVGGATIIKKGGKGMYPSPANISKRACN